jgi:hypothetical protein
MKNENDVFGPDACLHCGRVIGYNSKLKLYCSLGCEAAAKEGKELPQYEIEANYEKSLKAFYDRQRKLMKRYSKK